MPPEPNPPRASQLRESFAAALALSSDAERRKWLKRLAADDPALAAQLCELLDAHRDSAGSPLDELVKLLHFDETLCTTGAEAPPFDIASHPVIGKYKLLELLGEGGMGTVYMAQQTEPVRRRVALKVVKPGMDSREVMARFEAERQALAKMEHPHIARVLDAGTTDAGRPYFVMELVCGVPITEYCRSTNLGLPNRLRLFIDVCHAVQHAHLKGIIHRDLKPSNVLVTLFDGRPIVKVIDFGVAKALHEDLTERTLFTQFASLIGTPLYMSPEQAEPGRQDIDTRSDIYSLGVLLYELLTGTMPIERETLRQKGIEAVRRMIREDNPPRPSTRLSTLRAAGDSTLSAAAADHRRLTAHLRHELDWVVMQALEKDRTRRYQSAKELAEDVQRFLDDAPVHACPPSWTYRSRKLIRRYKGLLAAASIVLLTLIGGLAAASWWAYRALRAEQAAVTAKQETAASAFRQRQWLYDSDMLLAAQAWRRNDVREVAQRLARHRPSDGETDLRAFEWHYLQRRQELPGRLLLTANGALYDLAQSPDGSRVAVVGSEAIVRIIDLASEQPIDEFPTGQGESNGIAFSPDGLRIAAVGDDGTLREFDVGTHVTRWTARAHEDLAYRVAYVNAGRWLATSGRDPVVRLWDADNGTANGTLNTHQSPLEYMVATPSGHVVAGDRATCVSVWDAVAGRQVCEVYGPKGTVVGALAYSPAGYVAFGTVEGELSVFRAGTGTLVTQRRFTEGIQSLAFAPDGSWMVMGDRSGNLRVLPFEQGLWDVEPSHSWTAHTGRVYAVAVTADGRQVISAGEDGRMLLWQPWSSAAHRRIDCHDDIESLAAIDADTFVLGAQSCVDVYNQSGDHLCELTNEPGPWEVAVAQPAQRVFAANSRVIAGWSRPDMQPILRVVADSGTIYSGIAVTPDGRTLAVFTREQGDDYYLSLLDTAGGPATRRQRLRSAACRDIDPTGRWLACDSNNEIQVLDLHTGKVAYRRPAHAAAVRCLRFSGDGRRLASISADRMLKVWSIPDGELLAETLAHRSDGRHVAWTRDGRRIATSGSDRMLRLWDGDSLQLVWEYPPISGAPRGLAFLTDDHRLICLAGRQNLLILDGTPQ